MEELKEWLQNRIGEAWDEPANKGIIWKDRLFAYTAVLEKIEEIEKDKNFNEWYGANLSMNFSGKFVNEFVKNNDMKNICRVVWDAGIKNENQK